MCCGACYEDIVAICHGGGGDPTPDQLVDCAFVKAGDVVLRVQSWDSTAADYTAYYGGGVPLDGKLLIHDNVNGSGPTQVTVRRFTKCC